MKQEEELRLQEAENLSAASCQVLNEATLAVDFPEARRRLSHLESNPPKDTVFAELPFLYSTH